MAIIKLNSSFEYNSDKKDYYVQMKRRRFPWWIFLLLLIPLFIWLYKEYEEHKPTEVAEEPIVEPEPPQEEELPKPVLGCGVHFCGGVMSDTTVNGTWGDIIFKPSNGEYVGAGLFANNKEAFPYAMAGTLDGLAVDMCTRLIIYSEPDFKGDVIIDIVGPILINSGDRTDGLTDDSGENIMTKSFTPALQKLFPPERRKLSTDFSQLNMNLWANGSCKIICEPCQEDNQEPEPPTVKEGDTLPKPTENCGVHFSGWFLSDKDGYPGGDCSEIFQEDEFGDYVGQGYYPDNTKILPKSMRHSFDAVAISSGTQLIIYRKPNFEGGEVLNVIGPILIENVGAKGYYDILMTYTFKPELQKLFPPERRKWSSENMHNWARGSCKIICTPCNDEE